MSWIYLLSGLFLGWNLGANDAGNIYGTATATKMLKFATAAVISSVFVILGAMISGYGTVRTIGELGDINAIAGSFTVSISAAFTVFLLMRRGLVVSVSQAIIGAIIGWNIFTASPTDMKSVAEIISSWIMNPVLAGIFSYIIYSFLTYRSKKTKMHILRIDVYMKRITILVIAFAAYSLGANNIAKVIGVFIASSPFRDIQITEGFTITAIQQLFFTGAVSIVIGIITYSNRTTETVGTRIYRLTPLSAVSVIFSASLVLFIFSSSELERFLNYLGLPAPPLVPVSITQAMVGGVMGVGFAKGGRYLNFRILGKTGLGWVITPVAAGAICLVLLFIMQNVFDREVYREVKFEVNKAVIENINRNGIPVDNFSGVLDSTFESHQSFRLYLTSLGYSKEEQLYNIFKSAKLEYFRVDSNFAKSNMNPYIFSVEQIYSVMSLHNEGFRHRWQLVDRLKAASPEWNPLPETHENRYKNKKLAEQTDEVCEMFLIK